MNLKSKLQRMLQIVEDAERVGALADIERDILLAELREAYTELKFGEVEDNGVSLVSATEPAVAELSVASALPIIPAEEESETEEEVDEPEVEVELIFDDEPEVVEEKDEDTEEENQEPSVEEPVAVPAVEEPAVEEPAAEQVVAEPAAVAEPAVVAESVAEAPAVAEPSVEEPIIAKITTSPKRSALLSLYEDAPAPVLGEQFHETPSVADTIACPKGVAENTPVASLREAIGLADKFMLIRELFGGDGDAYEKAVDALDAQPSFDDCIIYIAEHYTWSPNGESTKFMMELLQRKYN